MLSPSNLVHGLNNSEMAELISAIGFRLLNANGAGLATDKDMALAVDCWKLARKIRANAFRNFPPITDEERNLYSVGKLAAAVVSYRNRTQKGLRDCKEMIEWACSLAVTQGTNDSE